MSVPRDSLWRHPDFMKLWAGGAVSSFGDAVTLVALPLTAVVSLGATPVQMGLLGAAAAAPNLLISLFVGVWVDRHSRRPIMIAAQIGRAVALGSIPLVSLIGGLGLEQLYLVAFVNGTLAVFADAASFSFLPALVGRARIVEANARFALKDSVVASAGPAIAGALVQVVTAPLAIIADALSFLASAASWVLLKTHDPPRAHPHQRGVIPEIREGLRAVYGDPVLRATTVTSALGLFALSIQTTVLVLYLSRDLGLTSAMVGIVFSATGIGSIAGAALAAPAARRLGPGPAIALGECLVVAGMLLVPLAGGPLLIALILMGGILLGIGSPIYVSNQISLRQLVTPHALLGRVNTSRRFLIFGLAPLGSLAGGALGESIGPRATLAVAALVMSLALAWVLASPVWSQRTLPAT